MATRRFYALSDVIEAVLDDGSDDEEAWDSEDDAVDGIGAYLGSWDVSLPLSDPEDEGEPLDLTVSLFVLK